MNRILHTAFYMLLFLFLAPNVSAQTYSGTPYNGPHTIPGSIQAEDFDNGGTGIGYSDTTSGNQGGQYRTNENVDINLTSDGSGNAYEVGNVKAGEWLKYTVNVTISGNYSLLLRAAAVDGGDGGRVHLEVDGINKTGPLSIANGVWQGYTTIKVSNITLSAGMHIIKLSMDVQDPNSSFVGKFNWLYFEPEFTIDEAPVEIPSPGTVSYYVSPSGNDSSPGSISQPWKTITKAANTLTAGQTVYIRTGNYNERLVPKNSGTVGNYIIYSNFPGETVTLDGTGITIPRLEGIVNLYRVSFIRITGLRIINSGVSVNDPIWNMGIMAKYSHHLAIDNNYVGHTYSLGMDISAFTHHSLIHKNEVDDHFGDGESTLSLVWYAHHNIVSDNYVHHSNGEGINTVAGAHDNVVRGNKVSNMGIQYSGIGFYSDAWTEHTYNNTYYNNISHNNYTGFAFSAEAGGLLENITIYNNVIYSNRYWGIIVSNFPWDNMWGTNHPMKNIRIINNTLYANDTDSTGNPGIHILNPQATGVVIRNNISSRNLSTNYPLSQLTVASPANATIENNLFYGGVSNPGSNSIQANPLFINAGVNFHLQSNSNAINGGSSVDAPNFDFDNYVRPVGPGYDIGAFEYGASVPYISQTPTPTSVLTSTPTSKLGDANDDGKVDTADYAIWLDNYYKNLMGYSFGDFNSDGSVDGTDYAIWSNNYGK